MSTTLRIFTTYASVIQNKNKKRKSFLYYIDDSVIIIIYTMICAIFIVVLHYGLSLETLGFFFWFYWIKDNVCQDFASVVLEYCSLIVNDFLYKTFPHSAAIFLRFLTPIEVLCCILRLMSKNLDYSKTYSATQFRASTHLLLCFR